MGLALGGAAFAAGEFCGTAEVFEFAACGFGVGEVLVEAFAFTGAGQRKMPLGCKMQSGGMNGLLPLGTVITCPPGGIGAPGGGAPPFAHGL